MLSLVPRLHDLVGSTASRTVSQLRELGVDPTCRQVSVAVIVGPSPSPARRLLAETLIDMLLRFDPLIGDLSFPRQAPGPPGHRGAGAAHPGRERRLRRCIR